MATSAPERKLTRADYVLLPERNAIQNLLGGELRMTPAPSRKHQEVLARLYEKVGLFARDRGLGCCWFSPFDVFLSDVDVVQPDLLFVGADQVARVTERGLEGPPTLAVEVLSESNRRQDEIEKRSLYERAGVVEYWTVDPERERVRVYRRPTPGAPYAPPLELAAEPAGRLATPLLPGLEIALTELFRGL
jgi:Uma2 family endonuclease